MTRFFLLCSLVFLFAAGRSPGADYERREIRGIDYHVLIVSPERVSILWKGADGQLINTFPKAAAAIRKSGATPLYLMNGGIFEPGAVPSGLLVQDGEELLPLNEKSGRGNFYLEPNGVFLIESDGTARVLPTKQYALRKQQVPRVAVQSGPLLLSDGQKHPKFNEGSSARLHRNGVGVRDDGKLVFLMSDFHSPRFPNLWGFAEAFVQLGCREALFLDGDISQMSLLDDPGRASNHFASIIAVLETKETE